MRIISWDVGVIHLAYCVIDFTMDKSNNYKYEIIDWDNINLIEDDRIDLVCSGSRAPNKKTNVCKKCTNRAIYFMNGNDNKIIGFCRSHLDQHEKIWSTEDTLKLFRKIPKNKHTCTFVKKNKTVCGINAGFVYNNDNSQTYLCTAHHKSELKNKTKDLGPKLIKNTIVKKYPTADLLISLWKKLDNLLVKFSQLAIDEIIIENQPSLKNPKMKAIASGIYDFFSIRAFIDKSAKCGISLVRYLSPSNKLKIGGDGTIEVFKNNKDSKQKYKLTKQLSIKYTKQLLVSDPIHAEYLDLFKKKDDLCDAFLQGLYYLTHMKYKINVKKSKSGSKINAKTNIKKTKSGHRLKEVIRL